jgi:pimeloyl-ACP methyl ester carboxylesterase
MNLDHSIDGKLNKETILFVHGAGANADQFLHQQIFFSDLFKVVCVSLRGHGNTPTPIPNLTQHYTLEENANDILELINYLNLSNIHYVGNSAGGVIGYLVVSRLPDKFLSLTTFGTTGHMSLPKFASPLVKAIDLFMIKFFKHSYFKMAAKHAGNHAESREAIYRMFFKASDAIPHSRYHLAHYNFLNLIETLPVPYFLIQCELDSEINKVLKTTKDAISKNLTAKIVTLDGAGHMANLDRPEAFNQALLKIIEESRSMKP